MWTTSDEPGSWLAKDLLRNAGWMIGITAGSSSRIADWARQSAESGVSASGYKVPRVAIPEIDDRLESLRHNLNWGQGVLLIKGLPILGLDRSSLDTILVSIAARFGRMRLQDRVGSIVVDVQDEGRPFIQSSSMRGHQTNHPLRIHTDGGNFFFLFCINNTQNNDGRTFIVDGRQIFHCMSCMRPDLLIELCNEFSFDTRGLHPLNIAVQRAPIFSVEGRRSFVFYKRGYIETAQCYDDVARLTDAQICALDCFENVGEFPEFRTSLKLAPGDMLVANNLKILHGRTGYVDPAPIGPKRHMKRVWVSTSDGPPMPTALLSTWEFWPTSLA